MTGVRLDRPIAGPATRLRSPGVRAFALELTLAGVGGLVYFLIRGAVVDRVAEARDRGQALMELEQRLGLFWEPAMQGWILSSRFLIDLLNGVYFWSHMPVIVVAAVVLFRRRPAVYFFTRNAFLVSAAIALVMYYTLPVAPPRFFPDAGFVDTMALYGGASYQAEEWGPFVNPYAALPSLHVGWSLLIAVAIWMARPRAKFGQLMALAAAGALVGTQFIAVIMTGNHYVLDAVVGAGVAGAGVTAAAIWLRYRRRSPTVGEHEERVVP